MTRRFFRPYYLLNALLLASYAGTRQLYLHGATQYGRISGPAALGQWEMRIAGVLTLAMGIHGLKAPSTDAIIADAFLYGKLAVAFLAALTDWRVACYYLAAVAVAGAVLRQPHYDGPHALARLTGPAFLASVYDASADSDGGSGSSAVGPDAKARGKQNPGSQQHDSSARKLYQPNSGAVWLVACVDPASPACIQIEPVLAGLSLKYTSDHLRFGVLNIASLPKLAERLRISLDPVSSRQIPTIIMFEKGAEVGRIPSVDQKSGRIGSALFRPQDIINGFDLPAVSAGPFVKAAATVSAVASARKTGKNGR